jgi:magnesium-transporting ATPase (P-type)
MSARDFPQSPRAPGPAAAGGAGAEREQPSPPWHALEVGEALERLDTSAAGLAETEARARLARHGPNRLPSAPRRGPLVRFALQFHNVLIYVLLASAAVPGRRARRVVTPYR